MQPGRRACSCAGGDATPAALISILLKFPIWNISMKCTMVIHSLKTGVHRFGILILQLQTHLLQGL